MGLSNRGAGLRNSSLLEWDDDGKPGTGANDNSLRDDNDASNNCRSDALSLHSDCDSRNGESADDIHGDDGNVKRSIGSFYGDDALHRTSRGAYAARPRGKLLCRQSALDSRCECERRSRARFRCRRRAPSQETGP